MVKNLQWICDVRFNLALIELYKLFESEYTGIRLDFEIRNQKAIATAWMLA